VLLVSSFHKSDRAWQASIQQTVEATLTVFMQFLVHFNIFRAYVSTLVLCGPISETG